MAAPFPTYSGQKLENIFKMYSESPHVSSPWLPLWSNQTIISCQDYSSSPITDLTASKSLLLQSFLIQRPRDLLNAVFPHYSSSQNFAVVPCFTESRAQVVTMAFRVKFSHTPPLALWTHLFLLFFSHSTCQHPSPLPISELVELVPL